MKELKLDDVREVLRKIIPAEKIDCIPDDTLLSASFTDDLGLDSLDFVQLSLELEFATGVSIPDREEFASVREFLRICNGNKTKTY